jgi:hypothetical protein
MQSKPPASTIRIGRVSIEIRDGDYLRLRFTIDKIPYQLPFGRYSLERLEAAKNKAREIETDIYKERFDTTLDKYRLKPKQPTPINASVALATLVEEKPKILTLFKAWEIYKEHRIAIGEDRSNSQDWKLVERVIEQAKDVELTDEQIEELANEWLETYARSNALEVGN